MSQTTRNTGRTPSARLADAADELSEHGFDVTVDLSDETEFTFDPNLTGVSTDVALQVARDVCDDNRVELALEGDTGIVRTP